MKVRCAHDKLVNVGGLRPHPKNRNKHPEDQIERLARILEYQGWRYPVKVSNLSGFITSGHGRLLAAKHLGWTEVPVNYQDYESEEQEYADVQADNAIASWAELDLAGINADIGELGPDFDIDLLGIKDFEIDVADKHEGDPDEVPEPQEPIVKRGELYVLGAHRLMCGDSTCQDDVAALMNGEKADMVFTSPPYNAGHFEVSGPLANQTSNPDKYLSTADSLSPEDYRNFLNSILEGWLAVSESVMVNIALLENNKRPVIDFLKDNQSTFKETLFWVKSHSTPHIQPGIVTRRVEPIYCFGANNSRQFRTATFKGNFTDVIEGESASKNEFEKIHAATFPVYLPEKVVLAFSGGDSVVADPFLGSGSTLIACEKTNRSCYGMEIDPIYCGVILDRWAKYTGKDPVREDGTLWSTIKANGTPT